MKNNIQIISGRLIIRPMQIEDAEAVFKYRSYPVINRYQTWIPKNIEDVYDFINKRISKEIDIPGSWFQFVIIKKEDEQLIGDLGIHFLDEDGFQAELGITLDKNQHGKGYALEAMTEIINFLFIKLNKHRIIASIDPMNKASIKLTERLGFRKEAHFRKSIMINNEWVDDLVYAVLKDEWKI